MPDLTPIPEDEYGELVVADTDPGEDFDPEPAARRIEWEDAPPAPRDDLLHFGAPPERLDAEGSA